jgi:hypothetical protein
VGLANTIGFEIKVRMRRQDPLNVYNAFSSCFGYGAGA